jgi:protein disulfide-isomerase A1
MKKTGPLSENIKCEEISSKASGKLNAIFFGAGEGANWEQFAAAARSMDNYAFFNTDAECAEAAGVGSASVGLFRTFDESPVAWSGEGDLTQWLKNNSVPTLFEFEEDYIEAIFGNKKAAMVLFDSAREGSHHEAFKQASKDNKGEILFSTSSVKGGIQERLAEFIGVSEADLPTLRIISPEADMKKFTYEGDVASMTADNVSSFLNDFKTGNLKVHLKSAPVPESNDGPVKVVVGSQFEEIVMDTSKDVFVKFFAPWCGHCKSLAPKWEQLGEHVTGSNLVIADFDATENEAEGVAIQGYPTLKFYPRDNKGGIDYNDGREYDDLVAWLAENSDAYKEHFAKKEHTEEL